jgi:hypothetical protein
MVDSRLMDRIRIGAFVKMRLLLRFGGFVGISILGDNIWKLTSTPTTQLKDQNEGNYLI